MHSKMQARLALEQGKNVFLVLYLVTAQPWAADYADRRGATNIDGVATRSRRSVAAEGAVSATVYSFPRKGR